MATLEGATPDEIGTTIPLRGGGGRALTVTHLPARKGSDRGGASAGIEVTGQLDRSCLPTASGLAQYEFIVVP